MSNLLRRGRENDRYGLVISFPIYYWYRAATRILFSVYL